MNKFYLIFILLCFFPFKIFAGGSVIGNGGDPIFYFLEVTRSSFVETVKTIILDPNEKKKFCDKKTLSDEQIKICRDFLFETANQLLTLNQGLLKTLFVLKEEPLLVEGPDGRPMSVAARTLLGPEGVVEFHRDSVKLMAPTLVLFLIAHEFSHKALFQGRYVTDNEPVGPFATGRELLDTMASAIVDAAKRNGKIGSNYGIRDRFDCQATVNGTPLGNRASTPRAFLSEDLMSYEISLSRNPTDSFIYIPESTSSELVFRVITHEPANCRDKPEDSANRSTTISIVRVYKNSDNVPREEILVSQTLAGYNPVCEKNPVVFGLSFGNVRFSCKYYGVEATTSSFLKLFSYEF